MNQTRRAAAAQNAIAQASVYSVARAIADDPTGKQNMVRFPDGYRAEAKAEALARKTLGESGRGKGLGVGQRVIGKVTGLAYNAKGNKPSVFLGLLDLTSRKADDSGADFRTRTLANLFEPERRVDHLELADHFGKFVEISLRGLPIWPSLPSELQEEVEAGIIHCLKLGLLIHEFDNRVNAIKRDLAKAGIDKIESPAGIVEYLPPAGETYRLVNANGEPVQKEKREVKLCRLSAIVESDIDTLYSDWTTDGKGRAKGRRVLVQESGLLPDYMRELAKLKAEYESHYELIRPFEMGQLESEIERLGEIPETVEIGQTIFEVSVNAENESDYPPDTAERIGKGELRRELCPVSRGKWTFAPAQEAVKQE
jgi:hypothetical protein